MEKLKKENLHIQYVVGFSHIIISILIIRLIEPWIVDLSNWTKINWDRILKTYDYAQLFNKSKRKLNKDKIDEKVKNLLHNGCKFIFYWPLTTYL